MYHLVENRLSSSVAVIWVLLFSIVTPSSMILCVGHSGHLALEMEHETERQLNHSSRIASIGHSDCGSCSDTPLNTFYGLRRLRSMPERIRGSDQSPIAFVANIAPNDLLSIPNSANEFIPQLKINPLSNFSAMVLIC